MDKLRCIRLKDLAGLWDIPVWSTVLFVVQNIAKIGRINNRVIEVKLLKTSAY